MTFQNADVQGDLSEISEWRRQLHQVPELNYDVFKTAAFVAGKLREFGCDEVVEGIGRTGVVGVIKGNGAGRTIGLRSDMDALPIFEETNLPYRSTTPGQMHACGHDGHMAMLLGAARRLARSRDFSGRIVVVFQPAEEGGAGGRAMVQDGLMERFAIDEIYGMHNMPGMPIGKFAIRPGPFMAATDTFDITVTGRGGHAAKPNDTVDPVVIAAQIVIGLQTIISRNVDPVKAAVISVTRIRGGDAYNVIPQAVTLSGTCRSLLPEIRDLIEVRLGEVARGIAAAHGAVAEVRYSRNYPVTVNHASQTDHAIRAARAVVGEAAVEANRAPLMGGEDFAYMLEKRPGAMIFTGNGDSAGLHHPAYDFNDHAIGPGVAYWDRLARDRLAV